MQTSDPPLPLRLGVWRLPTGSPMAAMISSLSLSASQVALRLLTPAAVLHRPCPSHPIPDRRLLLLQLHRSLLAPAGWHLAWQRYACDSPRGWAHSSHGRQSCSGCRCHQPGPCAAVGHTAPSALEASAGGGHGSARMNPLWQRWYSKQGEQTHCHLLHHRRCCHHLWLHCPFLPLQVWRAHPPLVCGVGWWEGWDLTGEGRDIRMSRIQTAPGKTQAKKKTQPESFTADVIC